jgi:hypothetical protein
MNLSISNEKFLFLMNEGVVLGYHIYLGSIEVDPSKVAIIHHFPTPQKQKDVRSFLGNVGYYIRFINSFSKLVARFLIILSKNA